MKQTSKDLKRMKNFMLITFFMGIVLPAFAQSASDTLVVEEAYEHSKNVPLAIDSGTVVISHARKLYLLNQLRYDHYQRLRNFLNDNSIDSDTKDIVSEYERKLNERDLAFDKLAEKCKEQSVLYEQSTKQIKASLTGLEGTLDLTQRSLQGANTSLGYAMEQLSTSKRSRFWSKFGLFGGGIGIGVLTGLLLSK